MSVGDPSEPVSKTCKTFMGFSPRIAAMVNEAINPKANATPATEIERQSMRMTDSRHRLADFGAIELAA